MGNCRGGIGILLYHQTRSGSAVTKIRSEEEHDATTVHIVHEAAFPTDAEARLVDRLRQSGKAVISLVAELDGRVVAHVMFSPVTIEGAAVTASGVGLAPVAVLPERQRSGMGSALIRAGLDACRDRGCPFVVVLGAPAYYRRFGFRRADERGLGNEYGAAEEFMVIELRPGGLPAEGGLVRYAPEFAELDA